jgi:hypothetical protein
MFHIVGIIARGMLEVFCIVTTGNGFGALVRIKFQRLMMKSSNSSWN